MVREAVGDGEEVGLDVGDAEELDVWDGEEVGLDVGDAEELDVWLPLWFDSPFFTPTPTPTPTATPTITMQMRARMIQNRFKRRQPPFGLISFDLITKVPTISGEFSTASG